MEGEQEHRSFVLTREGTSPDSALRAVLPMQVGIGIFWFVFCGLLLCPCHGPIGVWLPLNYLLFDVYLLVRDGLSGNCYRRSSRRAKAFLRVSPLVMVPAALCLGLLGSALR